MSVRNAVAGLASGLFVCMAAAPALASEPPDPGLVATLTFTYFPQFGQPPDPEFTGSELSGLVRFYQETRGVEATVVTPLGDAVDIGHLGVGDSFTFRLHLADACFGAGACQLHFSFGGEAAGFAAFAFPDERSISEGQPPEPERLAFGLFEGSPVFRSGPLVAYDAPVVVGLWETSLQTAGVPEPTAWALMLAGFGLAGVALRRRRAAGFA